jgi:hypothetical protein
MARQIGAMRSTLGEFAAPREKRVSHARAKQVRDGLHSTHELIV